MDGDWRRRRCGAAAMAAGGGESGQSTVEEEALATVDGDRRRWRAAWDWRSIDSGRAYGGAGPREWESQRDQSKG